MNEQKSLLLRLWQKLHLDFWLLLGLIAITGYGLLVLYSASGANEEMFRSRIIQVILGFTIMIVMAQFSPRFYQRLSPFLFMVGIILLILVELIGVTSKGAQRWLDLGIFRFQPSEIERHAYCLNHDHCAYLSGGYSTGFRYRNPSQCFGDIRSFFSGNELVANFDRCRRFSGIYTDYVVLLNARLSTYSRANLA